MDNYSKTCVAFRETLPYSRNILDDAPLARAALKLIHIDL